MGTVSRRRDLMLRTRTLLASLLSAGLSLTAGSAAHAGMIAESSVTPFGSQFMWTYNVEVTNKTHFKPGDYFTIYDFQGALPGSVTAPAGWDVSVSDTTKLAGNQTTPNDSASFPNYTFTWNGTGSLHSGWTGEFSIV